MITDNQGRVLLTEPRDNGHGEALGGVSDLSEDIATGLLHEVEDETGLQVEPIVLTGVCKNIQHGVVVLVFRCKNAGGRLTNPTRPALAAGHHRRSPCARVRGVRCPSPGRRHELPQSAGN
ncbi:NUDIX hydrolase [Nonomuraea sp. SBT364]|uniref:NUDIX hydrolase n=1 Tax=Nonomuraea sp. SBT364 TaxID=1580530 RepID=UPI0018CE02F0|nr:NUDIX domain-containing protein [Nonomuraea sp. SBT364]